jgi:hypothetical protein
MASSLHIFAVTCFVISSVLIRIDLSHFLVPVPFLKMMMIESIQCGANTTYLIRARHVSECPSVVALVCPSAL